MTLEARPYKGVRDFYPEDQFVQNHIFGTWRRTMESFGYLEYGSSILEPSELYRQKTGEEIVNEQTYTFLDRGDREVTLRPELTPTTARMVAAKRRELALPIRWYSIPNLFRYEAPQKGRLREHWQLNADLFGVKSISAETELIEIAYRIMRNFGAQDEDFIIRINSRRIVNRLYSLFNLSDKDSYRLSKLIDKRTKISHEEFDNGLREIMGEEAPRMRGLLEAPDKLLEMLGRESDEVLEIMNLSDNLSKLGISNLTFDISLVRGFDYYTGVVFEVFDTSQDNPRSLFGGGRYDELLTLFGEEPVPACGFGAGDVTLRNFLEARELLPKFEPPAYVAVLPLDDASFLAAAKLADQLREASINASLDATQRKIGDKIRAADQQGTRYVVVVGEEEMSTGTYQLKDLITGEEKSGPVDLLILEHQKAINQK